MFGEDALKLVVCPLDTKQKRGMGVEIFATTAVCGQAASGTLAPNVRVTLMRAFFLSRGGSDLALA